jgi:hypothetical protein
VKIDLGELFTFNIEGKSSEDSLKFYTKHFFCSNCGYSSIIYIKKGMRAEHIEVNCPNCDCKESIVHKLF